jgi:hypothetical protein
MRTFAIIKKQVWNDGSSFIDVQGRTSYNDVNLANLIAKDFAEKEKNKKISYTVVLMPFAGEPKHDN